MQLQQNATDLANNRFVNVSLTGMFILACFYTLAVGKALFPPIILSVLLALTFSPLVRWARKRGLPEAVSSAVIVLIATVLTATLMVVLGDAMELWMERLPLLAADAIRKLGSVSVPFAELISLSDRISEATSAASDPDVQRVVIADRGIFLTAASNLISVVTTTLVSIVLTYFLLTKGRLFYQKVVQSFDSMGDKKDVLSTIYDIERGISRYLFTIALINSGLGVLIGGAMWALEMPNPLLWGVAAAVLNFLPYVGALMGILLSALIAFVTFDSFSHIVLVPSIYLAITALEGQLVTPSLVGKQFAIDPVVVFINIALWSWLWGLAGALIAVPLLVVMKTLFAQIESLRWLNFFVADNGNPVSDHSDAV